MTTPPDVAALLKSADMHLLAAERGGVHECAEERLIRLLSDALRQLAPAAPEPEGAWADDLGRMLTGPELSARCCELRDRLVRLAPVPDAPIAALRELVALKGMKDKLDGKVAFDEAFARDLDAQVDLQIDYDRRKPKAWEAARAACMLYDASRDKGGSNNGR